MDTEYKNNQFDFLNIVIDCCAYLLLILFWFSAILFPLLWLMINIYINFTMGPFFPLYIIVSLLLSLVLFILSRGLIHRKRIIIFIVSVSSIYLAFNNINSILFTDKTYMAKYVAEVVLSTVEQLFIGLILFVSLFIKRLYTKQ